MSKKREMSKPANNTGLSWAILKDQPAINALRAISKEFDPPMDVKDTLRWLCVNMKEQAISKAKKIKALLKAS